MKPSRIVTHLGVNRLYFNTIKQMYALTCMQVHQT